jgi:ubiquinone/menaquinone biosynthesis C-methylase UbiE
MSFKQYIPELEEEWDEYWQKKSISEELELVKTDGLHPIFKQYLPKEGKILEAGCGLGKWIITLSNEGYQIEGVDSNQYALDKLKRKFHGAQVRLGDVKRLDSEDEAYKAYLSLGVVEHFEEGPDQALAEAHRVLKKDGIAIIEVPFDSPLRKLTRCWTGVMILLKTPVRLFLEIIGKRRPREKKKMRFYEYRYTIQELRSFVKKAGFSLIRMYPKDDLAKDRSISLWLDYPRLQSHSGRLFELNAWGRRIKNLLEAISPLTYCALIVAVAIKGKDQVNT